MNTDFSKSKEKRARSSSSEANNSFVKNVTSRVSGLLPAAVTKWFSSPSTSSANGTAPTADVTDSSTEDEAPESPVTTQPPLKRMRYTSPGSYNHYNPTEANCIGNELNEMEPCSPFGTVQSPPGRTTFRRETNFVSTPLRPSEDTADITEKDMSMFKPQHKPQHAVSAIGSSVATKRKSLFDSPNSAETSIRACAKSSCNTMKDPSQPCFKPSLLGSPFYPGRTMYGGASSSYINRPNIKQRKNTLVNESSNSDNTISHSTQRIMDLLEHYSSPLNEAKRIPQYTRTPRNSSLSSSLSSSSPPSNKVISYKTQELHVPSIASILRLKQKSRLMDTTNAARQIIASHSSTIDYVPCTSVSAQRKQTEKESSNKLTTKVKSRLTRPKRGESCDAETELPTPVDLPTAVLQIDQNNLPKFSFETPISTATSKPTSFADKPPFLDTASKITYTPLRKPDIVTSANPYKFSSPVTISNQELKDTPPKFIFGSPERSIDKVNEKKDDITPCVVGAPKELDSKHVTKEKDWQCSDCWVKNKPNVDQCVCCGGQKPSQTSKTPAKSFSQFADSQPLSGKGVNSDKPLVNNNSIPLTKPDYSSKWKCESCWVMNESSAEVCVCCGAENPKKSTAIKQNSTANDKDAEWKCDDCLIKNKSSLDECAACGASKPGSKQGTKAASSIFSSTFPKPLDSTLKKIVKTQIDKWECPSCLVRNDGDKNNCVCCETEREGATKENDKKSFNFGMNANTTFKFGIDPKAQVANSTPKPIEVKVATESKKEESETNNNVLSKTPTFTFGLPTKKSEDQADSAIKAEEKTVSAPKISFTFGIPQTAAAPAETPGFTSIKPVAPKATEEDKEKPQVVPKVDFAIPTTQEASKPLANIFASPLSTSLTSQEKPLAAPFAADKSAASTPLLNSMIAVEKKDTLSNSLMLQTAATSATTAPQSTPSFAFGSGSGIKMNNLFASPVTAAAATISFGSPLQSAPATATPMFQKTELTTTSSAMSVFPKSDTVSLFQKNEAPASAPAPPPLGAPAPLFSFGSAGITQTQQPAQAEKPKFNFSFGSNNKTEAPSLFKPPETKFSFGAATENKFSIPTSNTIGGGITISGNTMGGGNGLPVGNAISGNILSGGNGLPANSLSSGHNDMSHNPLLGGNGLPGSSTLQAPSGGIFGAPAQKENMWSSNNNNNSNNLFGSNTNSTNTLQKPGGFTFGTSTPFNANNNTPAFGSTQSTANVFGMNQNATSQPSMFSTPTPAGSMFGSPQPTSAPAPSMGMFGSPSVGATPTFGTPNPSIPTFEAPSLTSAPAPAFNFGGQQQATGIFGFGQQPQQQQQQQQQHTGGVYSFGAPAGAPQVQFNMGSAPNSTMVSQRRMRKAVRRTTQR